MPNHDQRIVLHGGSADGKDRQAILPIGTIRTTICSSGNMPTGWNHVLPLRSPLHGRHPWHRTLQNRSQHRASLLAVFSREGTATWAPGLLKALRPHTGGMTDKPGATRHPRKSRNAMRS